MLAGTKSWCRSCPVKSGDAGDNEVLAALLLQLFTIGMGDDTSNWQINDFTMRNYVREVAAEEQCSHLEGSAVN